MHHHQKPKGGDTNINVSYVRETPNIYAAVNCMPVLSSCGMWVNICGLSILRDMENWGTQGPDNLIKDSMII